MSVFLRIRARLRRRRLDGLIARGVERPGDRALTLREAQLAGPLEREKAARGLERALAAQPRRGFSPALSINLIAVRFARPPLLRLVAALRSEQTVEARGVALASRLLFDGGSPLYLPPRGAVVDDEALFQEARRVLVALLPWQPLPPAADDTGPTSAPSGLKVQF